MYNKVTYTCTHTHMRINKITKEIKIKVQIRYSRLSTLHVTSELATSTNVR